MSVLERISASPVERRQRRERRKSQRSNGRGAGLSVCHDDDVSAALCGDVSGSGIRLSLASPPAVGTTIKVRFGPDLVLAGRVVWVENTDCGIEFDEPVEGTIANLPAAAERRTGKGLPMANPASRFREGLNVTVVLPGCERKAVLRWTDDHMASFTLRD